MSSVGIRRRETSFQVRYRRGGRAWPLVHAGSFKTLKEARLRRDLVAGELAAGRDPAAALRVSVTEAPRRSLCEWAEAYRASRVDLSANALRAIGSHLPRILATFGNVDPVTITPTAVQEWVAANGDLNPSSLRRYVSTFQLLLDYAGTDPNPARSKHVKLPRIVQEEVDPPTAKQTRAILERVGPRWLLPLIVLEQTAMRSGEVAKLVWGDVDVVESRFRLPRRSTKSSRPRWVQVPTWLMEHVAATCPLEDRSAERRVFPRYSVDGAEKTMISACKAAEIPRFTPHQLRHRRATRWHHENVPAKALAERVGHADATLTLNLYSHVLDPGELSRESLEALLS
jgi:integrase